jgi:ABC-type sugar transport system ATPase subunit
MIEIKDLSIMAGSFKLSNINISIPTGKYGVLLGKTGSGKTTLMESLCGLKKIKSGTVIINDKDITHLRPAERGIGFVPQDGALFSTLSVYNNIVFSLKLRNWSNEDMRQRVEELSTLLKIEDLLKRSVQNLSGGEKQRVSLARAIASFPDVLCLDEPLSALDQDTHGEVCGLLKSIQQYTNTTIIHITHNPLETEMLADLTYQIQGSEINLTYEKSASKYLAKGVV